MQNENYLSTVFDFKGAEQGEWFKYFESEYNMNTGETIYKDPKPEAPEFQLRSMVPFFEERRKNCKKEYKMVHNPVTRQMERVGYYPDLSPEEEQLERDDAWDYAITGARRHDGTSIPLPREDKLKLIKVPAFARFAQRVFELQAAVGIKAKEEAEKN